MDAFAIFLIGLAMVVGIIGTVLPFLPGLPIVWLAALVYGVAAGFGAVGWICFGLISAVGVGGMVAGITVPKKHVEGGGAPFSTIVVGAVGAVIGFFVIPVVGLIIGGVAGVFVAEWARTGSRSAAWASTKRALVGFGLGAAVQMGAGVVMMMTWVVWVLLD